MGQNFISYDRGETFVLAPSLTDWLEEDHLVSTVLGAVDQMNLGAFYGAYRANGQSGAAYDPAMMVALVLYSHAGDARGRSTAAHDVTWTVEAVWRIESPRLIAGIARLVRDVALGEDLAQEALLAALEQWLESGVPDNPGAWLMAAAKHRGIDRLRRAEVHQRKTAELGRDEELRSPADDLAAAADDPFDDDLLRLVFTASHPILSTDARVALTLRLQCGLTTREIARAYLTSESAVAQRVVREKRTLSAARVPFEVPGIGSCASG